MKILFDNKPGEELPPFDPDIAEPFRRGHASLLFPLGEQLVLKIVKPKASVRLALEALYYFDAEGAEHTIAAAEFTARLVSLLAKHLEVIMPSRVAICQLLGDEIPGIIQTRYRILEEDEQAIDPPFGFVADNAFMVVRRHESPNSGPELTFGNPQYLFLDWDQTIARAAYFFQSQLHTNPDPESAYLAVEQKIQDWAAAELEKVISFGQQATARYSK